MKITRTTHASAVPSRTAAVPAVLAAALTIALAGPSATAHADTGWTERPAPFALGTSGLTDVTAAAPDAVWVGGYQWRRTLTPYFCGEIGGPCIPHVWQNPALQAGDGDSWSWLGTPGMTGAGQITEVDAVSAADTWAAGRRDNADGKACGPAYVAHGTGGGWSELPEPDGLGCLEALDADAAGAWVAGRADTAHRGSALYRWSGTGWTPHAVGATNIVDVRQRAPGDVWAVGTTTPHDDEAYAARYDGSAWHDMTPPQLAGEEAGLTAVLPLAADDVWVVGHGRSATGVHEARSYHWDGSAWREVPMPANVHLRGALAEDGAGGLWATADWRGVRGDAGLVRYTGGAWEWAPALPGSSTHLDGLARVPGTSTLIAAGTRDGKPIVLARD